MTNVSTFDQLCRSALQPAFGHVISTPYCLEYIEYLEAVIYIAGFISSEREVVNRAALDKLSPCYAIWCYAKFYSKHFIFIY